LDKKNFEKAIAEFSQSIRFDPESAEAYHYRGVCHRKRNDLDLAIADYSKAIELGRLASYADRGDAYLHKGDDAKSLEDLDRAIQSDPKFAWVYEAKAIIMSRKGDFRAVLDCFDKAISIVPKSDYWVARGQACERLSDWHNASASYSHAIRLDPQSAETYHKRGWCHRQGKDFDRAIADFSKSIELGRLGSYADRGDSYLHKGDDDKALDDLDKAIEVDPRNYWAYWVKSVVMSKKGDFRAVLNCLDKAIGIAPRSEYWIARGQACERLNDGHNAIASYSHAIRLDPESTNAYGHRAWQFVCLGMYGPATADYDIGISVESKNPWLLTGRGIASFKAGDLGAAIDCYNRAIEADPKWANAYIHRSWAYRRKGDVAQAEIDRQKALELDPAQAGNDGMYR